MGNKQQLQANNAKLSESLEEIESLPQKHIWTGDTVITLGRESITIPAYTDKELTIEAIADSLFDLTKFGYEKAAAGTVTYAESQSREIEIVHNLGTPIKMLIMELIGEPENAPYESRWISLMLNINKRNTGATENWFYGGGQAGEGSSSGWISYDDEKAVVAGATNDSDRFYANLVQAGSSSCYFDTGTYRWLVLTGGEHEQ